MELMGVDFQCHSLTVISIILLGSHSLGNASLSPFNF